MTNEKKKTFSKLESQRKEHRKESGQSDLQAARAFGEGGS